MLNVNNKDAHNSLNLFNVDKKTLNVFIDNYKQVSWTFFVHKKNETLWTTTVS